MRQRVLAAALAVLTAVTGFPQTDEWRLRMDEGAAAEDAGDYAKAASSYRAATEVAERFDGAIDVERSPGIRGDNVRCVGAIRRGRGRVSPGAQGGGGVDRKNGPEYALVLANLGTSYVETGQRAAGEKLLREALAIYSAADPPDELRVAIAQNGLAEVHLA